MVKEDSSPPHTLSISIIERIRVDGKQRKTGSKLLVIVEVSDFEASSIAIAASRLFNDGEPQKKGLICGNTMLYWYNFPFQGKYKGFIIKNLQKYIFISENQVF